jgi:hypothetical protein
MSDYASIMMREQAKARSVYDYDPREQFLQSRYNNRTIETFNSTLPNNRVDVTEEENANRDIGSRLDPSSVQDAPATRSIKKYIIIDASQRDYTKQPNPYTNLVFTFGSQSLTSSNPIVYTNNPFVPTFAVEQESNIPPIVGAINNRGWNLSVNGSNVFYRAYDPGAPRGLPVAVDTGYLIQPSGFGFGSSTNATNIAAIRLVRAVLPQRQFLSIPIDASTTANPGTTDASTSLFIQSNLVGRPYSTFSTYPYLLFNLNEFFGQYVGGNEPMRRSFSVMTQRQRQQTNFETSVGVQQYDYEPWGVEALDLQSPITTLKQLAITITDPIGTPFVQNDTLKISLIQSSENKMYLNCFTESFQYFSGNELRVGDRVSFYSNTIADILKSPILAAFSVGNPDKPSFVSALLNTTFPVLQLLDYVKNSNGIFVPRGASDPRTRPYVSSFNGFVIPNFVTIDQDGFAEPRFPGSIDSNTLNVLEPTALVGSNLPFLNTSLQPVYTLELETIEPDTSQIGGKIVVPR